MKWKITFFNKKVRSQALAFPTGILANFLHLIRLAEKFGPQIGMPYTRSLGAGLFEIRARGKEGIGRALFCVLPNIELVILIVFVKKSQKTPQRQIKLARKRMKEVLK